MTRVGAKTLLRLALVNLLVPHAILRSGECFSALWTAERSLASMTGLVGLTMEAASVGLATNGIGLASEQPLGISSTARDCSYTKFFVANRGSIIMQDSSKQRLNAS